MSDQQCDIHDVTQSASDLMSLGCTAGSTHFYDSLLQVQFSSFIANYVNGIIREVNDGTMSAWEGVKQIQAEHAALINKTTFYAKNGLTVIGGGAQIMVAAGAEWASFGWATAGAVVLGSHGLNNIYEGGMNLYNGPDAPSTTGFARDGYRALFGSDYVGDMLYGSVDLFMSYRSMTKLVPKINDLGNKERVLFNKDPVTQEMAYKQASNIALFFEMLVDLVTGASMYNEENK